jgi:L-phenylalanine/L-methionine N-acetyltransferase
LLNKRLRGFFLILFNMTRLIKDSDFSYIYGLYMHSAINPFLLYEMMSEEAFLPIFNVLLEKEIVYIYAENEQNIGMFKLISLEHRTSHIAYLGGVAIDPNCGGQGYGYKMMQAIIALGSEKGLKRIELSTATINERAIRLYEKVGFQKEGVLRNYTYLKSENRYLDEVMMSYLY